MDGATPLPLRRQAMDLTRVADGAPVHNAKRRTEGPPFKHA